METTTIERVQGDWKQVAPIAAQAADLFYGRLFELDPTLRPLFPEDMREQKKKLMGMLGKLVSGLNDLPAAIPDIQELGVRHNDYSVEEAQYATVGAALLWTLEQGLGDAWSDDSAAAWAEVYGAVRDVMVAAAREARAGSAA